MDTKITFVDALIQEQRVAVRSFGAFSSVLLVLAFAAFLFALRSTDKTFPGLATLILGAVSAVPIKVIFAVRNQIIYFQSFKDGWERAQESGDLSGVAAYETEFAEMRKSALTKGWFG